MSNVFVTILGMENIARSQGHHILAPVLATMHADLAIQNDKYLRAIIDVPYLLPTPKIAVVVSRFPAICRTAKYTGNFLSRPRTELPFLLPNQTSAL
ncbi:MAG: hypothetical protein N4A61_09440 [Pelagimonas sp.]|jgi:hypothetical protein|nr:hypothetical protein [Pelagimonas sp.]